MATTFILVPGSWHTTTHMAPLVKALGQHNYPARTVQLATVGLKSPRPAFADNVEVIFQAVRQELQSGNDVCLVAHSYGGIGTAEALNRLVTDPEVAASKGKLIRTVFIAAFRLPPHVPIDVRSQALVDMTPGFSVDDDGMLYIANAGQVFFNDLPPDAAQHWVDALEPVYDPGIEGVITSESWLKTPVFALLCKQDHSIPPAVQEAWWQDVPHEWIDAAHTPYVSQPERVAEVLIRAAAM